MSVDWKPANLDLLWPYIEHIARKLMDGDNVSADNIRQECREGRALCFASEDGVLIVTLVPNRFRNTFELVVWLAIGLGEHGAFERNEPVVDQIARDLGASHIVFHTRRRGWEKRLGPDWHLRSVTYVKEVGDGKRE